LEAAEKLAVEPQRVFKTLVVEADNETLAVAVLPVDRQLNLKLMAKAIGMKKVTMADPVAVSHSSGYVLVGGHRGLEIELSASDFAQATRAAFWVIT
jgi:Cys-tRNA(Pro)/Cys-tRNA(Cys) deacylase